MRYDYDEEPPSVRSHWYGAGINPEAPQVIGGDNYRPPELPGQPACVGVDPLYFFPDKGNWSQASVALRICATCPIREWCKAHNIGEQFGIWGGTTERQRRVLRQRLGIKPIESDA